MGWVKLDDGIDENPKTASLSDSAFALFVASLAYCNRNLTDGFIPNTVGVGKLRYCDGNAIPAIHELQAAGLWEEVGGGWSIHDYLEYQQSRAEALERMKAVHAAKVHGGKVRAKSAERDDTGRYPRSEPAQPAANQLSSSSSTYTQKTKPKDSSSNPSFDEFWNDYPRKVGKRAARAAFEKALKRALAEEIIAGAKRYHDDPNRSDEFTAHPTTWLNRDGWEDDPLPRHEQRGHESAGTRIQRELREGVRNGSSASGRLGLPSGSGLSRPVG